MELHCLPTDTPTTASSCSTDPPYDNCPPFGQRERARKKEMESGVVCPAVTRLPGPQSPLPGLAPAVAEVQTVVGGGRGLGIWPAHSYCNCKEGLGRQAWEAELSRGINTARGGDRGGEQGCSWGVHVNQSPSPSQSEEHRSALSLYDNLPDAETSNSLQDFDTETSLQEHLQEQMHKAVASKQIQGSMEDDCATEKMLSKRCSSNQDQKPDQDEEHEPELQLDSGSCRLTEGDLMQHHHLPTSLPQHLTQNSAQMRQTKSHDPPLWPPADVKQPKQTSSPRVPPPLPLADPSASALRSLLTSLQHQIMKQREEYEARIIR